MILDDIIPDSNRMNLGLLDVRGDIAQSIYSNSFVGCFDSNGPRWAQTAASILDWEFDHNTPGEKKLFADIEGDLNPTDIGQEYLNHRHAFDLYDDSNDPPYSIQQNYGICVDSSGVEGEDMMFGWRAAHPEVLRQWNYKPEIFKHISAHHKYAERGYRSDGWNGAGWASVAMKVGAAFRIQYEWADYTGEDQNEYLVARKWPPKGLPTAFKTFTQKNHPYRDGACTRFQGSVAQMAAIIGNGGFLHTSGVRTGGGDPFKWGRTGPHMQSAVIFDGGERVRKWARDVCGYNVDDDDAVIGMNQTWGSSWSGRSKKIPPHWGKTPEGLWIVSAKQLADRLSIDFGILPWVTGFATDGPAPPLPHPALDGVLKNDSGTPIRGLLELDGHQWYIRPNGDGTYSPRPHTPV